jgi:hypothetical protein
MRGEIFAHWNLKKPIKYFVGRTTESKCTALEFTSVSRDQWVECTVLLRDGCQNTCVKTKVTGNVRTT